MLKINTDWLKRILDVFLREEVHKIGMEKVVLGLSGGVDSAVVAALAQNALGAENVHALIIPIAQAIHLARPMPFFWPKS